MVDRDASDTGVHVLLVEDNVAEAGLVRQALRPLPGKPLFRVAHARRLQPALDMLSNESFDVVLLDLSLPDSDGLQTLDRVLERCDLPVIVMTGFDDQVRDLQAMNMGAQDYVVKGGEQDSLLPRTIRYAIERHQILAAQRRVEAELRATHEETWQLLESITSVLIGIDGRGVVRWWNESAESLFGRGAAETVGETLFELGLGWDAERVESGLSEVRKLGESLRMDDVHFVNDHDEERLLGLTIVPMKSTRDEISGHLIIGSDITDRRRLEAQLIQAQKLESIGQLAAGIAHEINTPTQYLGDNTRFLQEVFADITRYLERAEQALELGEPSAEDLLSLRALAKELDIGYLCQEIPKALNESLEGLDRVASIVRAMKRFSHPGHAEEKLVDINQALESTIVVARNEWKYSAELQSDFDDDLPLVSCFPSELNQVFLNLIVNAAHAVADRVGDGSEEKGLIRVMTRRVDEGVEVRVADTGTGIPEEIRSRIFDPFFTTKEVGRGTGQGLSLAYAVIVEKHEGTIEVESRPEEGTTFIVRIPLNRACAASEVAG